MYCGISRYCIVVGIEELHIMIDEIAGCRIGGMAGKPGDANLQFGWIGAWVTSGEI